MKKKPRRTPGKPTLIEFELIEITDPAELAELDRRCREAEKLLAKRDQPKKLKPTKRK